MILSLGTSDVLLAVVAGSLRELENLQLKRPRGVVKGYGLKADGRGDFQVHIDGALGELALSRCLNVHWAGKGTFKGADLGENIQVRTTERDGPLSLILHPSDDDDDLFYCVRRFERSLKFEIFKPMLGRDGKRQEFWKTHTKQGEPLQAPAFFAPIEPL